MDEQIAGSGKAIFMLHTPEEAQAFWAEPARAKVIVFYMPGCGWCHKFVPEFMKLAPDVANSDLLFGSASRAHMDKITKLIPNLPPPQGYPTTLIIDSKNQVKQAVAGFRTAPAFIDVLETALPELRGLPTLQYLQYVKKGQTPPPTPAQPSAGSATVEVKVSDRKIVPPRAAPPASVARSKKRRTDKRVGGQMDDPNENPPASGGSWCTIA